MLNDEELRHVSFRLRTGGSSYQVTHLPTGISVHDNSISDEPVVVRWKRLRAQLEREIAGAVSCPLQA